MFNCHWLDMKEEEEARHAYHTHVACLFEYRATFNIPKDIGGATTQVRSTILSIVEEMEDKATTTQHEVERINTEYMVKHVAISASFFGSVVDKLEIVDNRIKLIRHDVDTTTSSMSYHRSRGRTRGGGGQAIWPSHRQRQRG